MYYLVNASWMLDVNILNLASYYRDPSLYSLVRLLCATDKALLHRLAKYLLIAEKSSKEIYLIERQITPLDAIMNSLG